MSFFDSLLKGAKNIFKNQTERNETWAEQVSRKVDNETVTEQQAKFLPSDVEVIHVNPNVYLAHRGARICVGQAPIEGSVVDRMKHVGKVMSRGHESVTEHTNSIVLFRISHHSSGLYSSDFADFISSMHFCNVVAKYQSVDIPRKDVPLIYTYFLVGGSVRAWLYALREIRPGNAFKKYIKQAIYSTFEECFLTTAIKHNLLDKDKCTYLCDGQVSLVESKVTQLKNQYEDDDSEGNMDAVCDFADDPQEIPMDTVDLVYASPINEIYKKVKEYGFTLKDVYRVATVTFLFHDISRTCSHQLVRHRNGISQESQRYVAHDYTKQDGFVDPIQMNLNERYSDPKFKKAIEYTKNLNPFKAYLFLLDNGIKKEDARAWLPSNVKTQLLMTMTYEHYGYFLQLRLDKAAQKEIREVAEESTIHIMDPSKIEQFIDYVTTPIGYKNDGNDDPLMAEFNPEDTDVDELISEETMEPGSMKIDSPEKAQELFDLQEKFSKEGLKKVPNAGIHLTE